MKKYNVYLLIFILFMQFYPQQIFADSSNGSKTEIKEATLFSKKVGEEIELYEDQNAQQLIGYLPDDVIVELIQERETSDINESISTEKFIFIRYKEMNDVNEKEILEGYVHVEHIIPIEQADQYRIERLTQNVDEKVKEKEMPIEADKASQTVLHEDKETEEQVVNMTGVALKQPVSIYADTSRNSAVLKNYRYGHQLKYRSFNKEWHRATVFIDGEPKQGYIHSSDVGERESTSSVRGIALKNKTSVYSDTSRQSTILKKYNKGHVLRYKVYNKDWFTATVYINGKAKTGYIHISDVETSILKQDSLFGISVKKPTHIYSNASTSSKTLKSYKQGSILKYRTFTKEWYEATVIIKGKAKTGYILASDVETGALKQETLRGVGIKNNIHVYNSASRNSKVLRSYKYGRILKYRTFTKNWYEATVIINGVKKTGYIHKSDVGDLNSTLTGYGQKNPTTVYAEMSTSSRKLKSYNRGTLLKYRPHTNNWLKATVYVNGVKQEGYIQVKDVGPQGPVLNGYAYASPTTVYSNTSKGSKKLKSYGQGSKLKYRSYNSNWYQATVILNGKPQTGYIYKNDVTNKKPNIADTLKTVNKNNQLILVTSKGYNTSNVTVRTFERNSNGTWNQLLSVPGYIGKNGFASNKVEGDGKSPTGKYTISDAFGQRGNPGTKLPFRKITNDDVWVDDPTSKLYNTWQKRSKTKSQWKSAENMNHRLYTYGFIIDYNTNRIPYKGSAIFFHVGNSYTVGCTATNQTNVVSILKWIDPKKKPVIIQTPEQDLWKY